MAAEFDVAVGGHICFDIIPKFPDTGARTIGELLRPGKLVNVGPVATSTGGPVSNTGIGLHIMGIKVAFMAKVGDDDFGKAIIERLERIASSEGIKVAEGAHTSYTVAIAPPGIDRIFVHHPGTNDTFISTDVGSCADAHHSDDTDLRVWGNSHLYVYDLRDFNRLKIIASCAISVGRHVI